LPEIVRQVLQFPPGDYATLYAAICVSRTWFHAGVDVL
jgi:hypothetical protein